MSKIPIEKLELSKRARHTLQRMNVALVDELLDITEEELPRLRGVGVKTVDEIIKTIRSIKSGDIDLSCLEWEENADYDLTDSQLNIPVEALGLSARARHILDRMKIVVVKDLLSASTDEISRQRDMGEKTITEIREVIRSIKKGEIDLSAMDSDEIAGCVLADDMLDELSRHSISELSLSKRANSVLCREEYTTMDKVASLTAKQLGELKEAGPKCVDEIKLAVRGWLSENYVLDPARTEEGRERLVKDMSGALEPIINVHWRQLYKWMEANDAFGQTDACGEEGCLENNLRVVLSLPQMKSVIKGFWLDLAPDGIIEIKTAKDKLLSLGLTFDTALIEEISCANGIVEVHRNCYLVKRTFIYDAFLASEDTYGRNFSIVKRRLEGESLQSIGLDFGLTREGVRLACKNILTKFPLQFEDYFSAPYEYFHLLKDEFGRLFPEVSPEGYEYLFVRHKRGEISLSKDTLPGYLGFWKDRLCDYLEEEAVRIDKKTVTRQQMICRVLAINADTPMSIDELEKTYYQYLYRNGFPADRLRLNMKSVLNYLRNASGIVFDRDSKVRFCFADPKAVWNAVDFTAYKDLVVSADLIYRDYSDLMDELDIRDGYELFYVIKTSLESCWKGDFSIDCRRVPVIVFGDGQEAEQAIRLLKEISPVEYYDYYAAYEERFGLRKESAQGNQIISGAVTPYYLDGQYRFDAPAIADEDIEPFKQTLAEKTIWFIDDIEAAFDKICVHSPKDAINSAAFRRIGYLLFAGYVINEKYGSTLAYLNDEIFSGDVVNLSSLDRRLVALSSFVYVLDQKKRSLEYIETAPKILFSRKKVEDEYGLTMDDIRQIQMSLKEWCKDEYFNADSIWRKVESLPLIDRLKGNKWMLTCIMRQQEGIYSLSVSGNIILSSDYASLNLSKICLWLVSMHGKMYLDYLTELINDTFGCNVPSYKMAEKLRSSGAWDAVIKDTADDYIDSLVNLPEVDDDELSAEDFPEENQQ